MFDLDLVDYLQLCVVGKTKTADIEKKYGLWIGFIRPSFRERRRIVIDYRISLEIAAYVFFAGLLSFSCSSRRESDTIRSSTDEFDTHTSRSETPSDKDAADKDTNSDDNAVSDEERGTIGDTGSERDTTSNDAAAERAEALLDQMTLAEKIDYIGGYQSFNIRAVPRLGIPEIKMSDGPMGCRNDGPSTAYPAGIGLAATFDEDMAETVGASMGRDCRARGVHILLAPGVNIYRSPLAGRNFEYFGEDPLLSGKTAAAFIRGVQSQGVLATVKHFAANNQEWDRNNISSEVDERTLREIYFPAFERAIREGEAKAVMTAYNLLNGIYCSHHSQLLKEVLKGDFAFDGMVMSDWGAVHDARAAFEGGCDLEMPAGNFMNLENLLPLFEDGTLSVSDLDDKVRRILRTLIAEGFLDRPQLLSEIPLDDLNSRETALDTARKSIVLIKNENGLLPLRLDTLRRIAVIGPNADPAVTGGGGSSYVTPNRAVSLLDGLLETAPSDLEISYHPGIQETDDPQLAAEAKEAVTTLAASAEVVVVAVGFNQSAASNSAATAFTPNWPPAWAASGYVETEGYDHPFDLPAVQVQTVLLAASVNPNTIVIANGGGAVNLREFVKDIPALLWAWYPGQEGGFALSEILFGDVNPSGKLPITFGENYEDYPSAPYYPINDNGSTPYTEGIFVGYRGFEKNDTPPLFPFGFGLSYTAFEYTDLSVVSLPDGSKEASLTVKNVGDVEGTEVVELYVAAKTSRVQRPIKELAAFARVSLLPKESGRVVLPIEARSFAFYDVPSHSWVIEPGEFEILVGASSTDIRLRATVTHLGDWISK